MQRNVHAGPQEYGHSGSHRQFRSSKINGVAFPPLPNSGFGHLFRDGTHLKEVHSGPLSIAYGTDRFAELDLHGAPKKTSRK